MVLPNRRLHLVALDIPDAGVLQVLVVAADPLARAGLSALLGEQAGTAIVGTASPEEDLNAALDVFQPDLILWDLGVTLPEDLDPFQEADVPVVALLPDETLAPNAWAAGARALLLRDADPTTIAIALLAARQGLVVIDPTLADTVLSLRDPTPPGEDLTPREAEVLALVAEGLPNKLIADRLDISENTVKYHLASILGKLGARTRTEAVIRAARLGLVML